MMSIKKHIPNTITSMNLLCGAIGVVFACEGRFTIAFPLMLSAAVFDFLDGFAARLLGAYSDTGKELDSLADVISFGLLPSVMLFFIMKTYCFTQSVFCFIPLLIAVFSALRLAKFNIDERQHESFLGLPTPACAILCGALVYYTASEPDSMVAIWCTGKIFIPVLSIVLCTLLVCEIPMFSIKFKKDDARNLKRKRISFAVEVAVIVAVCIICKWNWSAIAILAFSLYIVKNIVYSIVKI